MHFKMVNSMTYELYLNFQKAPVGVWAPHIHTGGSPGILGSTTIK